VRSAALLLAVALTFSSLALTSLAHAETRRIAIADDGADAAVTERMRAELIAAGFEVIDVEPWATDAEPPAVAEKLAGKDVVAALRVGAGAADVWLVDTEARATLFEVIRAQGDEAPSQVTIAVRAVEVVRAELAPTPPIVVPTPPPPAPAVIVPAPAPTPAPAPPPYFPPPAPERGLGLGLEVGIGATGSPGGISVAPSFFVAATWMPSDHVGVGVLVAASPFAASVTADEGSAAVWTGFAGLGLVIEPTAGDATWGVRLEPGIAGTWLHMSGSAEPPFEAQSATIGAALPYLRAALRVRLSRALSVELGALGGVAVPRPVIAFAGHEVADWGRPLVFGFAGIEWRP
jgi:hypothetical protein